MSSPSTTRSLDSRTYLRVPEDLEQQSTLAGLNRAKEQAEAASRAKDHFLATLSHELRTPLSPVLTTLDALLFGDDLSESMRGFLELIRRNVELEARLIDDLLDHTRIANGKLRLQLETVDAHALMMSVIDICRREIEGKRLVLTTDLAAERHHLPADPARLQQVLWNVLQNAVKFTPVGGAIAIRSANNDRRQLVIEVEDSGIGIDEALLPTIFDAFKQGTERFDGHTSGLGLGLAISKGIIHMHGGELSAASDGKDRGTTLALTMGTIDGHRVESGEEDQKRSGGKSEEGTTILLVEDHADTAMVMKLLLERKGYQVIIAPSVGSALELASRENFDLLISDIGLPDGSGIDLIQMLSQRRPVKGIALSGFGMEDDVRRSIEAGFAEHLIKPVSYQKLREAIQRLLC